MRILFLLLFLASSLQAHTLYHPNLIYECYELIDLGVTDLPTDQLSRANFPASLGPRINKKGHISGNTSQGGFVFDRVNAPYFLMRDGYAATVYDINDKGLALTSLRYDTRHQDWFLWPYDCCREWETLLPIQLKCLSGNEVTFRSFNNKGMLVGSRKCFNSHGYQAVFYTPDKGLQDLSCAFLTEINERGNIAGYESMILEKKPFLYHPRGGWLGFSDDLSLSTPKGHFTFQQDMAIGEDNTVYGSVMSCKDGKPYIYNYSWSPCFDYEFKAFDLGGMQISAVNGCQTLVGALGGEAVISNNTGGPVTLISRIRKGFKEGARLLEATDINDLGEIVGFGKWGGETHLFLLKPLR